MVDFIFEARKSAEQCREITRNVHFYHSFSLSNGVRMDGDWDIALSIADYRFPSLRGKRVLDIGPASGWFSFWMEAQGADVTVVETRGYGDFDVYGVHSYTGEDGRPPERLIDGKPIYYGPASASFWAMHDILESKVRYVNGRIYEVSPALFSEPFDLVFVGALLPHLRDPIGALRAARSVCRGLCIATASTWTEHDANPTPVQILPYTHIDKISWWLPNKASYEHWFKAAGFSTVDAETQVTCEPNTVNIKPETGVRMNSPMILRLAHATP
jgi:2-polyprenyl-3-methyl-5-hydroxy-6-metoxy-1,4-benzoquinol methylase